MNISNLATFLTIIETGSLVRAAERLNVTQSTVTARLKALESDLGQTLMHRDKSGVRLTAAGIKLRRYADVMTNLWAQARAETALPTGVNDLCHIGVDSDLWHNLGASLLKQLRDEKPQLAITLIAAPSRQLLDQLEDGQVDAALCLDAAPRGGQVATELGRMELVLVSSNPEAPLRFDPGYFYTDHGEGFGRAHAEFYADANTARLNFSNSDWALDHIMTHGGTSYFDAAKVAGHLKSGKLHLVHDAPAFHRAITLIETQTAKADWPWLSEMVSGL